MYKYSILVGESQVPPRAKVQVLFWGNFSKYSTCLCFIYRFVLRRLPSLNFSRLDFAHLFTGLLFLAFPVRYSSSCYPKYFNNKTSYHVEFLRLSSSPENVLVVVFKDLNESNSINFYLIYFLFRDFWVCHPHRREEVNLLYIFVLSRVSVVRYQWNLDINSTETPLKDEISYEH